MDIGQWVFSVLKFCSCRKASSFANVPSLLSGDAAMNSGNRKALLFHRIAASKQGMQTRSLVIHEEVVFGCFRPDFSCLPSPVDLSRSDFEVFCSIHVEASHFCVNSARVSHFDMRHRRRSHSYCIVILCNSEFMRIGSLVMGSMRYFLCGSGI